MLGYLAHAATTPVRPAAAEAMLPWLTARVGNPAGGPRVAQAAVIGVPDARWGEAVHAAVVMAGDANATEDELRAWCRERLAGYKCPRGSSFLRELPMSAAGKVLKNVLREQVRT